MTIIGPGWTTQETSHIAGLFPLAVERYYNSAMAAQAPAVTTVTATARYYALHGALAARAEARGWDRDASPRMLRRAEASMALVSLRHQTSPGHRPGGTAHGTERLSQADTSSIDLDEVTRTDGSGYSLGGWGFWGQYRGVEIRLGIVGDDDLAPGPHLDRGRVGSGLDTILDLAEQPRVTANDLDDAHDGCICRARASTDGAWLAELFAGRSAAAESIGGRQHQTMQVIRAALETQTISTTTDIADFIKYSPLLLTHQRLDGQPVARAWRGLCFRADSVYAWRQLWAATCARIDPVTTYEALETWFADQAPPGTLHQFVNSLPAPTNDDGSPRDAEGDIAHLDVSPVMKLLATILLGGIRYEQLPEADMLGFRGPAGMRAATEELSPMWVSTMTNTWGDRETRDFCAHLMRVMLNRSQRIAMMKSRLNPKTGKFTMPARVRVHDDQVVRMFNETANRPAFLVGQLLSLGTQLGIFAQTPEGTRTAGPRIEVLDA
jgi:hypothetical protein